MDFNKWDRIFMTAKECTDLLDLVDMTDFDGNEKHPLRQSYDHYPLHRFILTMPNNVSHPESEKALNSWKKAYADKLGAANQRPRDIRKSTFHHCYMMAGDHLDIRTLVEIGNEIREAFVLSIDLHNFKLKKKTGPAAIMVEEKFMGELTYWSWLLLTFILINVYILSEPEKVANIEVREVEASPTSTKRADKTQNRASSKGPHKVRLVRTYRLKKSWKTVVEKRIHDIRCPAWGVRGHYRHYKDGRVIFIQPYVKGKNRAEYKGKIYELMPKEM